MKATLWDKRSKKYDDHIKRHDSAYKKAVDRAKSLLTDSDVVLDFACASGEYSLDIATDVQRVHGIDLSTKMIELANQKARDRQIDNTAFDAIDVFDQRLDGQAFSAVLAFNIFHLLTDASRVLARLNDLLPTGGLLISKTPCLGERSWFAQSKIRLARMAGVAPYIANMTFADLDSLVSSNHFEIIESTLWDEEDAIQWIAARKS